jgi:hypothetical protein
MIPLAPMLTDPVWRRLSNPGERLLCGNCFFRRADERGINLTLAELRPCPFNLFHWPHSWFDLFCRLSRSANGRRGKPPAADEAAWRAAWLDQHPACIREAGPAEREPEQLVLPLEPVP